MTTTLKNLTEIQRKKYNELREKLGDKKLVDRFVFLFKEADADSRGYLSKHSISKVFSIILHEL